MLTWAGAKKGLVKTLASFIEFIGAYYIANIFYVKIMIWVDKIGFISSLKGEITSSAILEEKNGFAENVWASIAALVNGIEFGEERSFIIGNLISMLISFLGLFIICTVALSLLLRIVERKIERERTFKTIDTIFGALIGTTLGIFIAWFLAKGYVEFAIPFLSERIPELVVSDISSLPVINLLFKLDSIISISIFN